MVSRDSTKNDEELGRAKENEGEERVLNLKNLLIAAVLVAVGLMLTLISEVVFGKDGVALISTQLLEHLSTAFLIAGIWHAIDVLIIRREFLQALRAGITRCLDPLWQDQKRQNAHLNNLSDQIRASRHEKMLGFNRSYVESHPELYEDIVANSNVLIMVLSNGYVWIHSHRDELKSRFADAEKQTTIFLLDPESDAARVMEAKEGLAPGGYRQKVEESFSLLNSIAARHTRLEVYGVGVPVVQAIFQSESRALVVPRFIVEPSVPPVFEFEKNDHKKSYYKRICDDLDHLSRHQETRRLEWQ